MAGVSEVEFCLVAKLAPVDQLLYSTTRIDCLTSNGRSTGTGFHFEFRDPNGGRVPVIVTNRHVVDGALESTFTIHDASPPDQVRNPRPTTFSVFTIENVQRTVFGHPDGNVDLCIIPIAGPLTTLQRDGARIRRKALSFEHLPSPADIEMFTALEPIVMVGYPNGLWDEVNGMPIFRRGNTATHPALNYCGKNEFLIDAACFPGSSGSPVFLLDPGADGKPHFRFRLLGILYSGPVSMVTGEIVLAQPSIPSPRAVTPSMLHLGFAIKSERLREFEPVIAELFKAQKPESPAGIPPSAPVGGAPPPCR